MSRAVILMAAVATAACAGASASTTSVATAAPAIAAPAPPAPPTSPPAPPPAPVFDPAGAYELSINFGGVALPISMELYRENGVWRGYAGNVNIGNANVAQVSSEGTTVRVTLVADGGPTFMVNLQVRADETVVGSWEGNGDGSPITGRRTKKYD